MVTTDLASGAAHVISAGPVVEALLASAAIPGLFPPVTIDGRQLVDGALAANTPVRQAVDLGATDIYVLAVATLGRTGDHTAPADPALSALGNMVDAGTARHPQGSPARVHLMPAPPARPAISSTSGTARSSSPRATGSPDGGWPKPSPRPPPRREPGPSTCPPPHRRAREPIVEVCTGNGSWRRRGATQASGGVICACAPIVVDLLRR